MVMINPFSKLKAVAAYTKTVTRAYQRRIAKQEKLLAVSANWLGGYEAAIQNAQILISDYNSAEESYTGNSYKDYGSATEEIANRYTCKADWGTAFMGPVIDIRASLISGNKINIKEKKAEKKARPQDAEWLNEFLDTNGLNDYRFMEMVTSTEMEGRLLWQLEWDKEYAWDTGSSGSKSGMVRVIPHLWLDNKYEIEKDKYGDAETVEFSDESQRSLKSPEFVYRRFGGLMGKINDPVQKAWRTLTYAEAAEKCLRDLRQIDHHYVGPRPVFVCKTADEAKLVREEIAKRPNWKITAPFIVTADYKFVQPNMDHVLTLIKEFYINIQTISSITGIPVHWLALVDLMSNRSTADDLGDMTELAVSTERQIVTSALNELVKKAAVMQEDKSKQTGVDYAAFDLSLSIITDEQWRHLKEVYLPAAEKRLLPVKQLLDKMPDINAADALKELEEQNKANAAFMFKENIPGEEGEEEEESEE